MNRRAFLQTIAAISAIPFIGKLVPKAYAKPPAEVRIPLAWLARDVARCILSEMQGMELSGIREEARLGTIYTMQPSVHIQLALKDWPLVHLDDARERYTRPAALVLAKELKSKGLTRFAWLALPRVGEGCRIFDSRSGLSVRACVNYQPSRSFELENGEWYHQDEHMALRFDVLAGHA